MYTVTRNFLFMTTSYKHSITNDLTQNVTYINSIDTTINRWYNTVRQIVVMWTCLVLSKQRHLITLNFACYFIAFYLLFSPHFAVTEPLVSQYSFYPTLICNTLRQLWWYKYIKQIHMILTLNWLWSYMYTQQHVSHWKPHLVFDWPVLMLLLVCTWLRWLPVWSPLLLGDCPLKRYMDSAVVETHWPNQKMLSKFRHQ